MPPSRLNIDRIENPLGKRQRPLLKAAMPNLPQEETENAAVTDPHSRDKAERRRDSTENHAFSKKELVSHTAKLLVSSLSRMLPARNQPQTSSQIWDRVLSALHSKDFESARKSMLNLQKHPSASRSAFVNRRRALSILAVLVAVDEWSGKTPVSSRNSQLLSAGIAHGSPDAIAFAAWFHLKERWSTSSVPFEEICDLLVRAARHGHAACQAVLGIMLCPSTQLSNSIRRQLRTANELGRKQETQNHNTFQTILHGQARNRNGQNQDVSNCLAQKLNQDVQMLKAAASRGYFLALDHLERETQKGRTVNSKKRRREENSRIETRKHRVSPQEFFLCVQSAANQQIPYCVVRLAELLQSGTGCEKSEDDALLWLRTAANLNVPVAMLKVHTKAQNENQQVTAKLSRRSQDSDFCGHDDFAEENRANAILKKNVILLRHCEENISRWQEEQGRQKRVLAFHIIGNLSSTISDNMSSAVLHFIFEREREGWF